MDKPGAGPPQAGLASPVGGSRTARGGMDYLTVPEAAVFLRISARKVYDLVSRSGLPHRRAGARLLFERTALADWVRSSGGDRGMPAPPRTVTPSKS